MNGKIFGIGMSRTGTTSLHQLMEQLGYNSRHFIGELISDPAFNIPADLEVLLDSPIPLLYKNLDKKYPDSKFILTIRDKTKWFESMKWMFNHGMVIWNWAPDIHQYHKVFYHTTRYNKKILSHHYDSFHKEVFEYFKDRPNDLLTLNIDATINVSLVCNFFNIPVKDITFPKTNERRYATFKERIKYNFHYAFYKTNLPTKG